MTKKGGLVPESARTGCNFQRWHGARFIKECWPRPWSDSSREEQYAYLLWFMLQKFSIDKRRLVMVPNEGRKSQADVSEDWGPDFYMSAEERQRIAASVMEAYHDEFPQYYYNVTSGLSDGQ